MQQYDWSDTLVPDWLDVIFGTVQHKKELTYILSLINAWSKLKYELTAEPQSQVRLLYLKISHSTVL